MTCVSDVDLSAPEYILSVAEKARQLGVPLSGSFEVTAKCNFRCTHCYLGHVVREPEERPAELKTDELKQVLRAAVASGCLFAVFTGGEPLLRDDFSELYEFARRLGLIVTVFTNASLVDDHHASLFREYPPHGVEVTLYGASEQTYLRVTGVTGAFDRVRAGIENLLASDVRVSLKSMILKDNADDILDMEAMAKDYGVDYVADPRILPRLDGDRAPTCQRVEVEKAVEIEAMLGSRRRGFERLVELERKESDLLESQTDRLYQCGAGLASFAMDSHGLMSPCVLSRKIQYDAQVLGFDEAWRLTHQSVDEARWTGREGCRSCKDRHLCGHCVAVCELEHSSYDEPVQYVCDLGRHRREVVNRIEEEMMRVGSVRRD